MTQMRALAANRGGGPRRSKRDRAVQGQSFRNLVKLVEVSAAEVYQICFEASAVRMAVSGVPQYVCSGR